MRWARVRVPLILVGIAVSAAMYVASDQIAYTRAVRTQARAMRRDPSALRWPAHWPLDVYDSVLSAAGSPEAAERLVGSADTVRYYLVPIARSTDSALVQEFRFRVGPRINSVVVDYHRNNPPWVDGSDDVPSSRHLTRRAVALAWYRRAVEP